MNICHNAFIVVVVVVVDFGMLFQSLCHFHKNNFVFLDCVYFTAYIKRQINIHCILFTKVILSGGERLQNITFNYSIYSYHIHIILHCYIY